MLLVTTLGHYPVVLGIKWLQKLDVRMKWASNMAILNSPYRKKNYLPEERTMAMPGLIKVPDTIKAPSEEVTKVIKGEEVIKNRKHI